MVSTIAEMVSTIADFGYVTVDVDSYIAEIGYVTAETDKTGALHLVSF
jgi:hypothetical protein